MFSQCLCGFGSQSDFPPTSQKHECKWTDDAKLPHNKIVIDCHDPNADYVKTEDKGLDLN